MTESLRSKDLLGMRHLQADEIELILATAEKIKGARKRKETYQPLTDKTLGLIFAKSSTRTRVSMEVGMVQLGGYPLFLSSNDIQLGRGEPVEDTARVLSRYLDGIMIRTFAQEEVETFAKYASIPVINGLTDLEHPLQVLADLLTIWEHKGRLKGLKFAYIGDGNNMANSLLMGCAKMGMEVVIACPEGYDPNGEYIREAEAMAKSNGTRAWVSRDYREAAKGADILYTDVWTSMGQEKETQERLKAFQGYQINEELLSLANKDCLVMHCLPAHRGEEITHGAMESANSVIFDQAENRLHAQKAVLALLMGK